MRHVSVPPVAGMADNEPDHAGGPNLASRSRRDHLEEMLLEPKLVDARGMFHLDLSISEPGWLLRRPELIGFVDPDPARPSRCFRPDGHLGAHGCHRLPGSPDQGRHRRSHRGRPPHGRQIMADTRELLGVTIGTARPRIADVMEVILVIFALLARQCSLNQDGRHGAHGDSLRQGAPNTFDIRELRCASSAWDVCSWSATVLGC